MGSPDSLLRIYYDRRERVNIVLEQNYKHILLAIPRDEQAVSHLLIKEKGAFARSFTMHLYQPCLFCILMLWHQSPGGIVPPKASQFLEEVNNPPTSTFFKCKPTNPVGRTLNHLFFGPSHSGPLPSWPNHPRPGVRQLGRAPVAQSPLKSCKLANSKPPCPASPIPSWRKPQQRHFPSPPSPDNTGAHPTPPAFGMPAFLGNCD